MQAIYLALATKLPMRAVESVEVHTGGGLVGDRYEHSKHRHVSVFSTGELAEASQRWGQPIDPAKTRRNVLLQAGLLPRTPGTRFSVGPLALEVVRDAAPCRIMDFELGDGARAALRRRGGVICRVLAGGSLEVGDTATLPLLD